MSRAAMSRAAMSRAAMFAGSNVAGSNVAGSNVAGSNLDIAASRSVAVEAVTTDPQLTKKVREKNHGQS
jgi:hypothetical protein